MDKVIKISTVLGNNLKSRVSVRDFSYFLKGEQAEEIVVDFSGVNYITRSFADEFYNQFLNPNGTLSGLNVKIQNVSSAIMPFFDAVRKTQHSNRVAQFNPQNGIHLKFDTVQQVEDYISQCL